MGAGFPPPFALSLSTRRAGEAQRLLFFSVLEKEEGQGFDKLSPNGVRLLRLLLERSAIRLTHIRSF